MGLKLMQSLPDIPAERNGTESRAIIESIYFSIGAADDLAQSDEHIRFELVRNGEV